MADPFVAEIRMFPFNFAPRGWAFCDGQILPISQNTALFSLLGTTYGGNGQSTFALPNLQGSAGMHTGANQPGPGLSVRSLGEVSGSSTVTLITSEMPAHTHTANAKSPGGNANPSGMVWGTANAAKVAANFYAPAANSPVIMNPLAISISGGSQPHNNLMPYLTLNFCIALQGVFPPRS
ncbi:MAG TPA: tail fiber protein [Ferruginibacter sp.]|jgi:microcystin-dependent protein|nr:tail fiber protein [Ferruginibacter sp.]